MDNGAYSIVRYIDSVNDQRVNLGIVLFHPIDGFVYRHLHSLSKLRSLDDRIDTDSIETQLKAIGRSVLGKKSKAILSELCAQYRHGLVVTEPYPARVSSAQGMLEHIFDLLVTPSPTHSKETSQRQFVRKVLHTITSLSRPLGITVSNLGKEQLNGVSVNMGIRTAGATSAALWHPISLEAKSHKSARIERAKSAVMDVMAIQKKHQIYSQDRQIVAVQSPRHDMSGIHEALEWIKDSPAELVEIPPGSSIGDAIETTLRAVA